MADVTRDQIMARTYELLGEPSDVEEYNEETVLVPKANDIVRRICNGQVVSLIDKRKYRGGYLPFLDASAFYTYVQPVAAGAAIATTDTEITATTTNYLDATSEDPQYLLINGDIIKYEGKTATEFTGVTGIDVAHASGLLIQQLYKVPTSISKPYSLWHQVSTTERREIKHVDNRKPITLSRYYSVLRDGSQDLIQVYGYTGDDVMMLDYITTSTDMDSGSDVCTIPDSRELVAHMLSGELLWENEEYEDGQTKLDHGYALLDEMYSFYAKQTAKNETRITAGNRVGFTSAYYPNGSRQRYRLR